ncbi:hypothetical protein C1645_880000 [Glomus cerebriforme]|uniref:Uncharacterized protein n=1 Tax=Glomus cerebriforme TaxID=658196 RepID=A0A397SDG1_9GLOM|nr:hypothetical protein C1645_880000 [Glomus cerebriforme]
MKLNFACLKFLKYRVIRQNIQLEFKFFCEKRKLNEEEQLENIFQASHSEIESKIISETNIEDNQTTEENKFIFFIRYARALLNVDPYLPTKNTCIQIIGDRLTLFVVSLAGKRRYLAVELASCNNCSENLRVWLHLPDDVISLMIEDMDILYCELIIYNKNVVIRNVVELFERQWLKGEYDVLEVRLEDKYKKYFEDIRNSTHTFKQQLEDQHKSRTSDKLENVIFAKDLKIIALNDQIISFAPHAGRDGTIEPNAFISFHETNLWTRWREEAKDNPNI